MAVIRHGVAGVTALVAKIVRAGNTIFANRSGPRHTTVNGVTSLLTVAEQPIIAQFGIRRVNALVRVFVACVQRAGHTIAAIDGWTRNAAAGDIAQLDAIAVNAIATGAGNRNVVAAIAGFVALVLRAGDSIVAIRRRARNAALQRIACFFTIAEQSV